MSFLYNISYYASLYSQKAGSAFFSLRKGKEIREAVEKTKKASSPEEAMDLAESLISLCATIPVSLRRQTCGKILNYKKNRKVDMFDSHMMYEEPYIEAITRMVDKKPENMLEIDKRVSATIKKYGDMIFSDFNKVLLRAALKHVHEHKEEAFTLFDRLVARTGYPTGTISMVLNAKTFDRPMSREWLQHGNIPAKDATAAKMLDEVISYLPIQDSGMLLQGYECEIKFDGARRFDAIYSAPSPSVEEISTAQEILMNSVSGKLRGNDVLVSPPLGDQKLRVIAIKAPGSDQVIYTRGGSLSDEERFLTLIKNDKAESAQTIESFKRFAQVACDAFKTGETSGKPLQEALLEKVEPQHPFSRGMRLLQTQTVHK